MLHPNPVKHGYVVTTTHKTLGGALQHVIAAKAVAFKIAAGEAFAERQARTLEGARIPAARLLAPTRRRPGSAC